jgi:iron(III) transport system substrate-binding protein
MKPRTSLRWLVPFLAAIPLGLATSAIAQKTTLTVYTALETDQLKAYQEGFNKANPDIELVWVRDSTGVITAKLIAEKSNPKADVIMGVAATSMGIFATEGMLEPYAPAGLARIASQVPRGQEPAELGRHGRVGRDDLLQHRRGREAEHPEARDLEGPDQAGLQGPDRDAAPGVVGHGLLRRDRVAAGVRRGRGLEVHGRAAREHRAVHALGLAPVRVGRERRVRRRHLVRVPREPRKGAGQADRPRVPEGRSRLGPRGHRDLQGHEEPGRSAQADGLGRIRTRRWRLYAKNFAIVAVPTLSQPLPNVPSNYGALLVKNDFDWAAKNRDKILAEWSKRYESKAAPK